MNSKSAILVGVGGQGAILTAKVLVAAVFPPRFTGVKRSTPPLSETEQPI